MRQYGGFRHTSTRDWRRALRSTGSGTFASAAAINLGQTFTISCMVYLAAYGTVHSIWNVASGAGIRFTITTTGALSLNNGTDAAQISSAVVPLGRWVKVEAAFDGPTRATTFRIDGEAVYTGVMVGTTAWTAAAVVAMAVPIGHRVTRLQAWRRVLTQAESRADFYSWTGPAPDVFFGLRNSAASVTSFPGTDGGVALANAGGSGFVWTDDVPGKFVRIPKPYGYSFAAAAAPNGSAAIQNDTQQIISAGQMAALRAANKIVLGHWIKFLGPQTQSFRSLYLEQAGGLVGPAIRWDCTAVAGELRLTLNGRLTTAAAAASAAPFSAQNLRDVALGKWVHVAVVIDYVNSTTAFFLNGLPLVAAEAFTPAGTYHSDAVGGTERVMGGAQLSAVTAGLIVNTLQADHIVCAQASAVDTATELRNLVLLGTAPTGTVYRALLTEGVGVTSADGAGNAVINLMRDGANTGGSVATASANWRPDAP